MTSTPGPKATIGDLCRDLADEQRDLDALVAGLTAADWAAATPAEGWDVRDSLSHVCYFDEVARAAVEEPDRFQTQIMGRWRPAAGAATPDVALGRDLGDPQLLLRRWRESRELLVTALAGADPKARVPWYRVSMSPASMATARLMETWAHGVDIRDGLGRPTVASERLRHVIHLGFSARRYAFAVHDVDDPGDPVRLVVAAPGGGEWVWGPADAADVITGDALGVALLFTQRRHRSDTGVAAEGPVAEQWLAIAQAFAGPGTLAAPERGRQRADRAGP